MITLVNLLGLALLLVLAAVFAFIAVGVISVIADGARALIAGRRGHFKNPK